MGKMKKNKFMRTMDSLVEKYKAKLTDGQYESYLGPDTRFDTSKSWKGNHAHAGIDKKRFLMDKTLVDFCFDGDKKYLGITLRDRNMEGQMKKMAKEWKSLTNGIATVSYSNGEIVYGKKDFKSLM